MSWLKGLLGLGGAGSTGRVDGARARELVAAGALLVDVRSPAEFAGGHVQGARNVPVDQLVRRSGELKTGKPVVLYCRSGARSANAAGVLRSQGIEVYDLGPMSAW